MPFHLSDEAVALILKFLPRNQHTQRLLAALNAYLHGYEYEVRHFPDEHTMIVAIYRRGQVITSTIVPDDAHVPEVLVQLGYPRARDRKKR